MSSNDNINFSSHSSQLSVDGSEEMLDRNIVPLPFKPGDQFGLDDEEESSESQVPLGEQSLSGQFHGGYESKFVTSETVDETAGRYDETDLKIFDPSGSIGSSRGSVGSSWSDEEKILDATSEAKSSQRAEEDDHNQYQVEDSKQSNEWRQVGTRPKKNEGSNLKLTLKYFEDIGNLKEMLSLEGIKRATISKRGDSIVVRSPGILKAQEWCRTKHFHATIKFVRCLCHVSTKVELQKKLPRGVLSMKRWNEKSTVVEITFFNGFFAAEGIRNGVLINGVYRDVTPKVKRSRSNSRKMVKELAEKEKEAIMEKYGEFEHFVSMPWTYDEYVKQVESKRPRRRKSHKKYGPAPKNYASAIRRSKNIIPERASETVKAVQEQHKESKKMMSQQKREMNSLRDVIRSLEDRMSELFIQMNQMKKENQSQRDKCRNLEDRCKQLSETSEKQLKMIEQMQEQGSGVRENQSVSSQHLQEIDQAIKDMSQKMDDHKAEMEMCSKQFKEHRNSIKKIRETMKSDKNTIETQKRLVREAKGMTTIFRDELTELIKKNEEKLRYDVKEGFRDITSKWNNELKDSHRKLKQRVRQEVSDDVDKKWLVVSHQNNQGFDGNFESRMEHYLIYENGTSRINELVSRFIGQRVNQKRLFQDILSIMKTDPIIEIVQDHVMMLNSGEDEIKKIEPKPKSKSTKCFACDRKDFTSFGHFCNHVHTDHAHLRKCPYCDEEMGHGCSVGSHMFNLCRKFICLDKNSLLVPQPSDYS